MLDRNAQKNEVETGEENSNTAKRKMGKEHNRMESRTQQQNQDQQSSRKTKKKWEDEINELLKSEEAEATKGSDVKNKDTWIWAATQKDNWKEKEEEYAAACKKKKEGRH